MTDKIKDIINNFSDMKIIKALDCCIIGDCDNCPFYETRELCPNLILFVSDLINRQKAEIEELKSKNSNLTSDLTSLQNDLTSAKAEIEMDDVEIKELRIALQGYLDDITKERNLHKKSIEELNQAKAEIERLKATVDSFTDIGKMYSEIKAEAVKEFAERSEKELFIKQNEHREHWMETLNRHRGTEAYKDYEWSIDNWLRGYGEAVQDILAINQNFLKELEGEDDG